MWDPVKSPTYTTLSRLESSFELIILKNVDHTNHIRVSLYRWFWFIEANSLVYNKKLIYVYN